MLISPTFTCHISESIQIHKIDYLYGDVIFYSIVHVTNSRMIAIKSNLKLMGILHT